ncbi:MAG TPA: hypothetical protein VJS91_05470 [Nitrososphaeraceae archaeon]|nr:hypothetical protein [Nitrososphaeraceae archaeon]
MTVLNILLIISAFIFTIVLTGIVSAAAPNIYCYDEYMEDFICFETQKECESERDDDVMAKSKCYKSTD